MQAELTKSFSSAANTASQYPQYTSQIIAGAKQSFLDGADWAYTAGIIAILLGAALVYFMFPHKGEEERLLTLYQEEDRHPRARVIAMRPSAPTDRTAPSPEPTL